MTNDVNSLPEKPFGRFQIPHTFLADELSLPGKSVRNGKIRPETS